MLVRERPLPSQAALKSKTIYPNPLYSNENAEITMTDKEETSQARAKVVYDMNSTIKITPVYENSRVSNANNRHVWHRKEKHRGTIRGYTIDQLLPLCQQLFPLLTGC